MNKSFMKRINYLLAVVATVMMVLPSSAQENRKTILGIDNVSYSKYFSQIDEEMFRSQLVSAIQRTGRVVIVDYNATNENAIDADCMLSASLDRLTVSEEIYEDKETRKMDDGKYKTFIKGRYPYIKATVNYSIKIIDCGSGTIINQQSYTISSGYLNTANHKPDYLSFSAAHKGVMEKCVKPDDIAVLILNTFKVQGMVLQMDNGDARKAKTVYISLGSDDGVEPKQILEVFKEVNIAGEISQRLIGEVEITEILGSSRSLAKVRKGGDEILSCLVSGCRMPVRTRNVSVKLFGGVR